MTKPIKFKCPLDIYAHYLNYPPRFTAWLKSKGWFGYIDGNHHKVFNQGMAKR